jgi:hypothetical protein
MKRQVLASYDEPQQSVWTSQRQRWDLIDETLPANK